MDSRISESYVQVFWKHLTLGVENDLHEMGPGAKDMPFQLKFD